MSVKEPSSDQLCKLHENRQTALAEYFASCEHRTACPEIDKSQTAFQPSYATSSRLYYDLTTDFFQLLLGRSIHCCRLSPYEPISQALVRHEYYLAHRLGIQKEHHVLDVGCGVGGPACSISRFTGASITGLNINGYQLRSAVRYTGRQELADTVKFAQGDFMQMPFEPDTFDAAYAIEATCYAPNLRGVYREIFNALKPGGMFGSYEAVMTESYDARSAEDQKIRHGIEKNGGISHLSTISEALEALKAVGFEVQEVEDIAARPDAIRWYDLFSGSWMAYAATIGDFWMALCLRLVRFRCVYYVLNYVVRGCELLGILPPGSQQSAELTAMGVDAAVQGGRRNIFTPMYLIIAKKPANPNWKAGDCP